MSLATCCTACGTVFRVVQDQLKISEGWVRCGRCNEVFNALEGLFDLERDGVSDSSLSPGQEVDVAVADASELSPGKKASARGNRPSTDYSTIEPGEERHDPSLVDRLGAELFPQRNSGSNAGASSRFTALENIEFNDPRMQGDLLIDEAPASRAPDSEISLGDSIPVRLDSSATPEFLRHAEGAARWQRRWVRGVLGLGALILLGTLGLQIGHHFRDHIAARWPASQTWLAQWCGLAQCSIEPLRRIEDVAVESTTFTRAAGADQFRVSVVLRNRGSLALAVPSVDLSLTDASGSLLVRRALSPQDFRVASPILEPGSETQLQMLLATGTPLVTGYTVEIFYP